MWCIISIVRKKKKKRHPIITVMLYDKYRVRTYATAGVVRERRKRGRPDDVRARSSAALWMGVLEKSFSAARTRSPRQGDGGTFRVSHRTLVERGKNTECRKLQSRFRSGRREFYYKDAMCDRNSSSGCFFISRKVTRKHIIYRSIVTRMTYRIYIVSSFSLYCANERLYNNEYMICHGGVLLGGVMCLGIFRPRATKQILLRSFDSPKW